MSMPVMDFSCIKCGFVKGSLSSLGTKVYLLPNGVRLAINTVWSWCVDCARVTEAEDLSESACLLDLAEARERLATYPERPHRAWWQLQHFLVSQRWSLKVTEWERGYLRARTDIDDFQDLLQMLQGRAQKHETARCLTCGGRRVHLADPAQRAWGETRDAPSFIGLIHPGCGGQLQSQANPELRVVMRRTIVSYTPDGSVISDEAEGDAINLTYSLSSLKAANASIRKAAGAADL